MSTTRTQSQLCTATPISWFVQYHISSRLFAFAFMYIYMKKWENLLKIITTLQSCVERRAEGRMDDGSDFIYLFI